MFDTQFTFQNIPEESGEIQQLDFKPYDYFKKSTQFELSLNGVESGDTIEMVLTFWSRLYKRETIEKMADHFMEILELCLEDMNMEIGDLTLTHALTIGKSDFSETDSMAFDF